MRKTLAHIKMKHTLIILFTFLFLFSCKERDCEAFHLNHPVTDWMLFPDRHQAYTFTQGTLNSTVFKTLENISGFEEIRCYYCSCNQTYAMAYSNEQTDFFSAASYDSLNEGDTQISYTIDGKPVLLYLTEEDRIKGQELDGTPYNDNLNYTLIDSLTIEEIVFHDLLNIQFSDTLRISQIWVEKGSGLVAYELGNDIYIKE